MTARTAARPARAGSHSHSTAPEAKAAVAAAAPPFEKVLVANRGEIAVRVMRTCKDLGIKTVAVYSECDRDSLHVRLADEAVCVGPPPAAKSYLNAANIVSAALITGAEAIHPGYGFLAENASFAEICENHQIRFVGPSAASIEKMGDKAKAKQLVKSIGVPVVPGTDGPVSGVEEVARFGRQVGYPIVIKAAAGGGGRGMRVIEDEASVAAAVRMAKLEASSAFGNAVIYAEKLIDRPRHVEVQVLFDTAGHGVHLGERDCSIQRRYQKLIEECPSPAVDPKTRRQLGQAALACARACAYTGAGTVEFLVDRDGKFYFLEMNTRIQVEHPVTEVVTGVDLVAEQIRIAAGHPLRMHQRDVSAEGHSIECRICAEDPYREFAPSPGTITFYHAPGGPGVRVDSAAYTGYVIPPFYDSLVAKVISRGADRQEALARMQRALDEFTIEGVATTLGLYRKLVATKEFREASIHAGDDAVELAVV